MEPKKIIRTTNRALTNKQRTEQSARELEIAIRRKRVAELLIARVPHSQIAETLKVSKGTVQTDKDAIMRELATSMVQNVGEVFLTSLAKLDAMEMAVHNQAMSGEAEAIILTLKIEQRRAAMLGLDAAERARSGLRIEPPEPVIETDSSELLTPDGRPVANRAPARIFAAFANPNPDSPGAGQRSPSDGGPVPSGGTAANG